jgi:hypothetical protein
MWPICFKKKKEKKKTNGTNYFASVPKVRALIASSLGLSSYWGVDEQLLWNCFLGLSWGSSACVVIIESLFSMASKKNACIWFFKVMLFTMPWQVCLEYGEPRKSVFIKLL